MKRNLFSINKSHIDLTQGSIITNCVSEGYEGKKVWGLIITPRCDLAHEGKVNTVHYLPMVDVQDWFRKDGRLILQNKWKQYLKNKINSAMQNWDIKTDFIAMNMSKKNLLDIADRYSKNRKQHNEFISNCDCYYNLNEEQFKEYIKNGKDVQSFIADLRSGKLSHYYLIEDWEKGNNYKVIFLRNIRRIGISMALHFKKGFTFDDYTEQEFINNDLFYDNKSLMFEGFYYIDAQLLSPYVEHIMQSFSYNFTRIGVEDMDENTGNNLFDILKSVLL